MSAGERLSQLAPYANRLLNDDEIQAQIERAFANLLDGSRRAKREGPKKAVKDQRVLRQLATAATSATQAARTLRAPEPPKRHPVRRVVLIAAIGGGAALGYRQLTSGGSAQPDG